MLRKLCGLAVFGLIGIGLFGGITPGCSDSGDGDLAARFVSAQSAVQQIICGCEVERGEYPTQEQCITEEFETAPVADEACLRQVIEDFPAAGPAIACEVDNLDVLVSCLQAANCDRIAHAACPTGTFASASRLFRFEDCGDTSPEIDSAARACQLAGTQAANILVD
jgi:hypothetical protein